MIPLLSAGHSCTYKGITQGAPSLGSGKAAAIGTVGVTYDSCLWSRDSSRARSWWVGMKESCPTMETLGLLEQGWVMCTGLLSTWGRAGTGILSLVHTLTVGTSLLAEYSNDLNSFLSAFPLLCCQGSNLDHHFWKAALCTYIQPTPRWASHLLAKVFHHWGFNHELNPQTHESCFFSQAICILFSWHCNCQKEKSR